MTDIQKEFNKFIDEMFFPARTSTTFQPLGSSYPPYNILKLDETTTVLEIALAGFSETDITVTVEDEKLKVSGRKNTPDTANYIYKGIGQRQFERTFTLSKDSRVVSAEYADGILSVFVKYELPDERKPKQIQIQKGQRIYLTEADDIVGDK